MDQNELSARIQLLEEKISSLPIGSISTKRVNGKEYYYHRWTENKKRKEKYIPASEVNSMREQIQERKRLEKLKELCQKADSIKTQHTFSRL